MCNINEICFIFSHQNHKYDYGMKSENPLKHIHFYTKDDDTKGILLGDEKVCSVIPIKEG